ncbi:MAG: hypothetical protein D6722_02885 [Bacteroidetes bacterium]|nr:MAG: hypothetical protein D6722_02885 [Bacteroidota bacterium]
MPILLLAPGLWACKTELPADLTLDVTGSYTGTLTLYLDTDSTQDVADLQLTVSRVDDETILLTPTAFPAESALAGQVLQADLRRSPDGFIRTEGVVLTLVPADLPGGGTLQGVPFAGPVATAPDQHGRYELETGNLLFTVQILRNGVDTYELFEAQRDN